MLYFTGEITSKSLVQLVPTHEQNCTSFGMHRSKTAPTETLTLAIGFQTSAIVNQLTHCQKCHVVICLALNHAIALHQITLSKNVMLSPWAAKQLTWTQRDWGHNHQRSPAQYHWHDQNSRDVLVTWGMCHLFSFRTALPVSEGIGTLSFERGLKGHISHCAGRSARMGSKAVSTFRLRWYDTSQMYKMVDGAWSMNHKLHFFGRTKRPKRNAKNKHKTESITVKSV